MSFLSSSPLLSPSLRRPSDTGELKNFLARAVFELKTSRLIVKRPTDLTTPQPYRYIYIELYINFDTAFNCFPTSACPQVDFCVCVCVCLRKAYFLKEEQINLPIKYVAGNLQENILCEQFYSLHYFGVCLFFFILL